MPDLCDIVYPYNSVGVIKIFYSEGGDPAHAIGSGFLFQTETYQRNDLVIGAGHNLAHLRTGLEEVHFTLYGNRDVNSVALRSDGSPRCAIAGSGLPSDVGVMVLADSRSVRSKPILLREVALGDALHGIAAGGLAQRVEANADRSIYASRASIMNDIEGFLYFDTATTEPGMSGGPILVEEDETIRAVGLVQGLGSFHKVGSTDETPCGMATRIRLSVIEELVARALAGE